MDEYPSFPGDMNEFVEEAILLLADLYPPLAATLWLHVVEEYTEVELAARFGVDERSIRRWLNGYEQRGEHIWGAKTWLYNILDLFLEANRCHGFAEVTAAFQFASRSNPWRTPFPAALLDIFWQAMDANVLEDLLVRLREARRGPTYARAIVNLLECYDQGQLDSFFAELCPEPGEGCDI